MDRAHTVSFLSVFVLLLLVVGARADGQSQPDQSLPSLDSLELLQGTHERSLASSGGIGAFSPPAPGFSRTGSNASTARASFASLAVVFFGTLLLV
jgi:hypothetical protein